MFASLIIPALACRHYPHSIRSAVAYAAGVLGYLGGLVVSTALDLPPGAVIVWIMGGVGFGVYALQRALVGSQARLDA